MRYLKRVIYPLITGGLGFVAISIPFAYALYNRLMPFDPSNEGRSMMSPSWLYYDATMLVWLLSVICAFFAAMTDRHGIRQIVLFAPIYAPLCYAFAVLLCRHFGMI